MDFNKDYYGVLGVSPSAEDFLIKAAYKALAQRYHPDKLEESNQQSEDKIKALNEAYSILSDAHKRKQYDDYLKSKNVNKTTQSEYQEEQNRNETNQENGQLILFFSVAAIVSLIVNAILFIASIFVIFFSFLISIAGNLYQNFTAYSDEDRKSKQRNEELQQQHDEELKRKQQAEDLKRNQQHNESLKYKQQDGQNSGWVVVMVFIAIAVIAFVNYKPVTPPPVSAGLFIDNNAYIKPEKSPQASTKPVPSVLQETITFTNGAKYIGEVKNGKPEGQGTYFTAEGIAATGEFKNGLQEGQGTITTPNGNKYEVEFKNNQPYEQGKITFANGDNYEGEFKKGLFNGQGTATLANGQPYAGKWKNGKYVQNNPQATTQAESAPVKTHKKTSNKSKRENKALERAEAQAQEQEEVQIETREQPEATSKPLSLREKAEAESRDFSLRQRATDERQRAETQEWARTQMQVRE